MKNLVVFVAFLISSVASAQKVTIEMDMGSMDGAQIQVNQYGMQIEFGNQRFARERVQMTNGSLRIGSTVITKRGSVVQVVGMNPSTQQLSIRYSNGVITNENLSNLAVTNGCNQVFCVGEQLVTNRGSLVVARGFFQDGSVAIEYSNRVITKADVLSVGLMNACNQLFCAGDTAITNRGSIVKVIGFFADGSVAIEYSNRVISKTEVYSLSLTQAVCANIYINRVGFCGF